MSVKKGIFFLLMTGSAAAALAQDVEPSRLEYIPNHRQWDDRIAYRAEMKGGKIFVERNAVTFVYLDPQDLASLHPSRGSDTSVVLHAHALRVSFEKANKQARFTGNNETATANNYFLGNDPGHWASEIHAVREVLAEEVYPGIDLKYYSSGADFKYDWMVHAGSDPSVIRMKYDGCAPVLADDGSLVLNLSVGRAKELKPVAYQVIDGEKRIVECRYKLKDNTLSFEFPGGYDSSAELIIDPTLVFSSYTGSTADNWGFTATYDHSGNAITGGNVNSIGYPVTTGAYQMSYGGGGTGGNGWACDMAIAKFNATGTSLLFATYLGGSNNEEPHSIVVDGNNDILILGITFSSNYPVTAGAYDNTINGGGDMVISKLSSSGSVLLGSTFIGGSGDDGVNVAAAFTTQYSLKFNYGDDARGEIISDANNNYIVACVTQSANFPVTAGVIQPVFGGGLQDGVLFKLNSNLSTLLWSTYFGGTDVDACYDILQEPSGNFYVTGGTSSSNLPVTAGVYQSALSASSIDGYILHMDSSASTVLQCTYVGTPGSDQTYFVEQDRPGNIYVLGQTGGAYPVSAGVYANPNSGQFIQKFNPQLSTSLFSTTFGGGLPVPDICPTAFLVDTCQNIYAAGWGRCINYGGVFSSGTTVNLPVTANALQPTTDGCDFYFIILTPDASSLLYATFFGGSSSAEHVDGGTSRFDKNGIIYESVCAGCGGNSDFPTQPGVVSQTNNSSNCNNAVIKLDFDLASVVATAQATPDSGCTSKPIGFGAALSSGVLNYYWNFGDGSPNDTSLSPFHVYAAAGTYTAHFYFSGVCNSGVIPVQIFIQDSVLARFGFAIDTCTSIIRFVNGSTPGSSYLWNFGDGSTDTSSTPVHVYDSSGVYTVVLAVNPGACPSFSSVQINYVDLDTAFATVQALPDTGCISRPVIFNAQNNTGVISYYWDFGDGSAVDTMRAPSHTYLAIGTYTAYFHVTGYCNVDSFPVTVRIDPSATAAFSYSIDTCSSRITFRNASSNGIRYLWTFGDGRTDTSSNPVHVYSSSGNYTVTLIVNPGPCEAVDTVQIQFTDLDTAAASARIIPDTGCVNSPVLFSAIYNSGVISHYWNFGDGTPSDTSVSPGHAYAAAGNYLAQLVVTGYCNADTVPLAVAVLEKGTSSFAYTIDSCTSLVTFSNTSTGSSACLWDFGDGNGDTSFNPVHLYDTTGNYTVSLTVNPGPCENISTMPLFVNASDTAQFFVPNVFTPNGDGKNDEFVIRGINSCSDYRVRVYNRWGTKIFESSGTERFWDGSIDGHDAAEGVYYYLLELDGKSYSGHVTLLRK